MQQQQQQQQQQQEEEEEARFGYSLVFNLMLPVLYIYIYQK